MSNEEEGRDEERIIDPGMAESDTTICNYCIIKGEGSGSDIADDITRNLSNMNIVSPKSSFWLQVVYMLRYSKCKRSTHYSYLPAYQIISSQGNVIDQCVVYITDENYTQPQDVAS